MRTPKWLKVSIALAILSVIVFLAVKKPMLIAGLFIAILGLTAIAALVAVVVKKMFSKPRVEAGKEEKKGKEKSSSLLEKITSIAILATLVAITAMSVVNIYKSLQTPPCKREKITKVVIIAPVGRWSRNFSVPPYCQFRIRSQGEIKIKTWDGREIEADDDFTKPGNWLGDDLGDDLRDINFQFTSRENKEVKVFIFLKKLR